MSKLFTRRKIIELWLKQDSTILDSLCCPNCRDILEEEKGVLSCTNNECTNTTEYTLKNGEA